MTRYLLCLSCRAAWVAPVAASCCNARPLECSPWTSDIRVWFRARMSCIGWRGAAVSERANFGDREELRASLWDGVEGRGNRAVIGAVA